MYHRLSTGVPEDKYTVSVDLFKRQIKYLADNGFETVLPEDILENKILEKEKMVMITFDDGYISDYTLAFPILKKYGFKSVHFISTAYVNGQFDEQKCMRWEQIKKLKDNGFSIQSHSHNHLLLGSLSEKEINNEILLAKHEIYENLKSNIFCMSMPGGNCSNLVLDAAFRHGHNYLFTSEPGINYFKSVNKLQVFKRYLISAKMDIVIFKKIINQDRKVCGKIKACYDVRKLAKNIFGNKLYFLLWKRLYKYNYEK